MYRIPLRSSPTPQTLPDGRQVSASSGEIYLAAINLPAADGITVEQMRQALVLSKKLTDAKAADAKFIFLSKEEHAFLLERLRGSRWGIVDAFIVESYDAVRLAAYEPPAEAAA